MKRLTLLAVALVTGACSDQSLTAPVGPVPDEASPFFGHLFDHDRGGPGAVYVQTNNAAGNAVLVFRRQADGSLAAPDQVPTSGLGTGGGLGNQGSVVLSESGRFLYVTNAGSDEISAFRVTSGGLHHIGNVPSGGDQPISLAVNGGLLYVLNDGAEPNVTGFRIGWFGTLHMLPGSSRPLSTEVPDAAQVGISPDGDRLVVTEKATNLIVSWRLSWFGYASNRTLTTSASPTPFGFAFSKRGALLVSEAVGGAPDASVLSSYRATGGGWTAISPSVATTETAACWVVVTPNGKYAYTTNTGSASVSGFDIGHNGSLGLLDADGVTGSSAAGPIDAATSGNGRYLYVLTAGADAISAFRIRANGSLEHLGDTMGLPDGANGLAAK